MSCSFGPNHDTDKAFGGCSATLTGINSGPQTAVANVNSPTLQARCMQMPQLDASTCLRLCRLALQVTAIHAVIRLEVANDIRTFRSASGAHAVWISAAGTMVWPGTPVGLRKHWLRTVCSGLFRTRLHDPQLGYGPANAAQSGLAKVDALGSALALRFISPTGPKRCSQAGSKSQGVRL